MHKKWCQISGFNESGFQHMDSKRSFMFPISSGIAQFQDMPGLQSTLLSGYCDDIDLQSAGLSAIGEMVVEREEDGTHKLYPHLIAKDGTNYYFIALHRHFSGHWQIGDVDYAPAFGRGLQALSSI